MAKRLTDKQRKAIELLTNGKGMSYKDIAAEVEVNVKTLYSWRHSPDYALFQQELDKVNNERWQATVDAAREAAVRLCRADNAKFVEFVLKNEGYNPTQKVEAEISTDINITIEE